MNEDRFPDLDDREGEGRVDGVVVTGSRAFILFFSLILVLVWSGGFGVVWREKGADMGWAKRFLGLRLPAVDRAADGVYAGGAGAGEGEVGGGLFRTPDCGARDGGGGGEE